MAGQPLQAGPVLDVKVLVLAFDHPVAGKAADGLGDGLLFRSHPGGEFGMVRGVDDDPRPVAVGIGFGNAQKLMIDALMR